MTWERIPLKDVGRWYGGGTPSKANHAFWTDGSIPWLSPKDMGPDVLTATKDRVTSAAVQHSAAKLVPAGAVAMVTRSGILERKLPVALVPFETTLNQDMKAVVPRDDIDPRWLAWGLRAYERQILEETRKDGTTVASLEVSRLHAFKLPVPSLDEQHRRLDVLEAHLTRIAAAEDLLARASAGARSMVRSALQAGLRGRLIPDDTSDGFGSDLVGSVPPFSAEEDDRVWPVPDTWVWTRLGELFEINVGSTPSRARSANWVGDLPWVSSGEVAFGRISSTRERISRSAAGNPSTRIQPPGTVMLAMIGEGKTRGQAAILDIEAAHNQNCASIRVSETSVLPEFVYGYLEERYLETRRGGAGGQQPALNKRAIQQFAVPIPPLATQRRLVGAWDSAREQAVRLTAEAANGITRSGQLRTSLLRATFDHRPIDETTGHST